MLYQIDGVEYVYSMTRENQAIITVRFYVGQDRERSLVKLFKKINENQDIIPPGVTGWVVKPVEIDDVPVVTLTLTGARTDRATPCGGSARRSCSGCSALPGVSRAYVVGGEPRTVRVDLDPERLQAYALSPLEVQRAIQGANVTHPAGDVHAQRRGRSASRRGVAADRPERLAGPGRRRLQGPAGLPQGRGDGRGRPRRGDELRPPRLGPGARVRGAPRASRAPRSARAGELRSRSIGDRRPGPP